MADRQFLKGMILALLVAATPFSAAADLDSGRLMDPWVERYRSTAPPWSDSPRTMGSVEAFDQHQSLPGFTIVPAATGSQIVRVPIPFPYGSLPAGLSLMLRPQNQRSSQAISPQIRVLTLHPGLPKFVRRAMITFPYEFESLTPVEYSAKWGPSTAESEAARAEGTDGHSAEIEGEFGKLRYEDGRLEFFENEMMAWSAEPILPATQDDSSPTIEWVERGPYYSWFRVLIADAQWPRILEVRMDAQGQVAAQIHLQRVAEEDAYAPEMGWRIRMHGLQAGTDVIAEASHTFRTGSPFTLTAGNRRIEFPVAANERTGFVKTATDDEALTVTYVRCTPGDRVPHQPHAFRRAGFALGRTGKAPLNALYEPSHQFLVAASAFDSVYGSGITPDLSLSPLLSRFLDYHRDAIVASVLRGYDSGNVTAFTHSGEPSVYGMNRLNHCPPIFEEWYRSGDNRLRETAVAWCENFRDLSIWWKPGADYGGARYNNASAAGEKAHEGDPTYMWRTNWASHFCTKGFDAFFDAYEETGDPSFLVALKAQTEYAKANMHAKLPPGEPRNIGDVRDLMRLARFTGDSSFEREALRLFDELRVCLTPDCLFSQTCEPIEADPPYINDDQVGLKHPFAKPYIIGYALAGLPRLLLRHPDQERLGCTVEAVARFLARSQDCVGGWRYPHPDSSGTILSQAMEHAQQMCNALPALESQGLPTGDVLDAIERTLQMQVRAFERTGTMLSGLTGWELSTGAIQSATEMQNLYAKPEDRDRARDYAEGVIGLGSSPPDGLVYFPTVLAAYLERRPSERLQHANGPVQQVLDRLPEAAASDEIEGPSPVLPLGHSFSANVPVFREKRLESLTFPLAYDPAKHTDFNAWRSTARSKLLESFGPRPPLATFDAVVEAAEGRDGYEARKVVFNISEYERIRGYVLVPDGEGPFPAIVALHDHGAHFSIGKEKVIRPFGVPEDKQKDAEEWVGQLYGGKYIGDELARRGYVVFSMDALYWGDRGREEGVAYEAQQAIAGNLFQVGHTWAGLIAWDDIRSVDFVRGLAEVDPERIGAVGLSMGSFRTWQLLAASDDVHAGAAICWMGTTDDLTAPGNNQTTGQSAYSMLHVGLRNFLDYPDVASVACPKPMLFFNGSQDGLFPVPSVEKAYKRMAGVWASQETEDHLITKLWPVKHVFSVEMQEEAFDFLDRWVKGRPVRP